ncbi:MAG: phage tail tape measure protein [Afipia sp.]
MADAQKTIELIFQGVDKTGAATSAAVKNLESFGGSLKGATHPVADFTVAALKVEAGVLAVGAAFTTFAVKSAADFDAAFKQITTLFDATDEDLAKFKDSILEYASGSSASLEEITNSLSAAIGSGVEYSKSLDLIATAEKLSVATRADLKGTTEVLVSTLNAYGLSTSEAGSVSDKLFQIIKDGKIEMTDLSASLANITPIAATAGVSLDEIGAGIATLTAAGVQPSSAIDALRSALSNIIKPSEQAKKLANELGIEFDANALKSKGLAGVLDDVQKATGGSADKMAILFGDVQGLSAVMTLTGSQADAFAGSLGSMGKAAGAVDAAFAKMNGSVEQSSAKAVNALKVLLVEIGTPLLDEFGGIATAIAKVFAAVADSVKDGALSGLVEYIEGLAGEIQKAFEQIATNLPAALAKADLSGFTKGLDAVVGSVKGLFDGFDLGSADGLARAIETLGAAFLGLSKYAAGVIESFEPMFDLLVEVGKGAAGVDSSVFALAGNIGGVVTQANLLAGGLTGLVPLFEGLLALLVVKQGVGLVGAMGALATGSGALATALGSAGLVAAAGAAGYAVGTVLNDGINKVVSSVSGSETTLGAWLADLVNSADDAKGFAVTVDGLRISLEDLNKGVESGKYVWDDVTGAWTSAVKQADVLAEGLDGVAGAVRKVSKDGITEYVDAMGNVVKYTEDSAGALQRWNEAVLASGGVLDESTSGAQSFAEANRAVFDTTTAIVPIIDEATGKVVGYEQNLLATGKALDTVGKNTSGIKKSAEELAKAEEAAQKLKLELEKIASNERIKTLEFKAQIDVARIQADAQKVVAAFDSINTGIESTGETLSSLWDSLGSGKLDRLQQLNLESELDKESKRRDEALELQKDLTKAQIGMMEAQTDAINKGDGLIKISGDGLQPHLEAFMWEILKSIQVRVNADGLKMLLGT